MKFSPFLLIALTALYGCEKAEENSIEVRRDEDRESLRCETLEVEDTLSRLNIEQVGEGGCEAIFSANPEQRGEAKKVTLAAPSEDGALFKLTSPTSDAGADP